MAGVGALVSNESDHKPDESVLEPIAPDQMSNGDFLKPNVCSLKPFEPEQMSTAGKSNADYFLINSPKKSNFSWS